MHQNKDLPNQNFIVYNLLVFFLKIIKRKSLSTKKTWMNYLRMRLLAATKKMWFLPPFKLLKFFLKTYILGRIFSNFSDFDDTEDLIKLSDDGRRREIADSLGEEKVENFKKELEDLDLKHQKRLDTYQKRNKRYKELLNEYFILYFPIWSKLTNFRGKHLKNEGQFNEFKAKLIEEAFYAGDHPFFCEESPFYLNSEEESVKAVGKNQTIEFLNDNFSYYSL